MEKATFKKGGLVYTDDYKTVVGIDSESSEFTGTVPNGVQSVEEEAFSCCSLQHISLPDSVTYVGANLFCNSTELQSVRLPAVLKNLSPFMFCGCKSLVQVEMPLEVEDFSEGLFAECTSLEEIPFRAGIKTLPEGVFDSCTSITSLVIPDSVTKICSGAIVNCTKLETIVLPESLKELESGWISECPSLKHIRISEDNPNFRTDEDSCILYRKSGDTEKVELEIKNKSESSLPGFKEPDMQGSIISFDESEDETMDETVIFNEKEENIFEAEPTAQETLSLDSEISVPVQEDSVLEQSQTPASTEESSGNSITDARLAEILGQNKMYDDGEFSIMDIPEASEEEIASEMLASSSPVEEKFSNENVVHVEVPVQEEETHEAMEDRLKEIMDQNTDSFSISDIPMASEDEISANKILTPVSESEDSNADSSNLTGEPDIDEEEGAVFVSGTPQEESSFGEPVSDGETAVDAANDDKAFMQNLIFETAKVEQQNIEIEGAEPRILFVFAENVIETNLGKKFSPRLKKCCQRLSDIHKFTSIYYLNDVRLDTEKFKAQFISFMKDKDVLVACEAGELASVSENSLSMASFVGINLTKEFIYSEKDAAITAGVQPLKLFVQDNLSE